MARVMLLGGKPILVDGKVAMSSACCCVSAVPCPPCGGENTVDISGLDINYETCIVFPDFGGSTILHEGSPPINQTGYTMSNDDDPDDNPPGGCAWFDNGAAFTGLIRHDDYLNGDCSDFPFRGGLLLGWDIYTACIEGTWYCYIGANIASYPLNKMLFFYGFGSSTTLTNTSSFSGFDAISIDDPFIEWLNSTAGPQLFTGVGQNGTVTIHP